jgi:4-amino-4-deoxy-L-arabinose transferase-like glycosyltransferase
MTRAGWTSLLAIALVWGLVSFYGLGRRDLWSAGETREAQIAREMIFGNDYVVPKFNGVFLPWKPPLYHWMECAAAKAAGRDVDSLTSRLPSSFFFLAGPLGVFFLTAGLLGDRARLLAALVFLTAFKFSWMSRVAQIDAMFSVLTGLASLQFLRFYVFYEQLTPLNRILSLAGAYVLTGLAVLAKGPAGAILVGGSVFVFLLLDRKITFLGRCISLPGIALFLLIGGGWYFAVWLIQGNEFFREFFLNQNLNRYLRAFDHQHPPHYYILQFLGGFMPWTLFFIAGALSLFMPKKRMSRPDLFCLSSFLFVFLFFSFSGSKRGVYILPVYIPAAVITAGFLEGVMQRKVSFSFARIPGYLNALVLAVLSALISVFDHPGLQKKLFTAAEPHLSEFDRIMFGQIGPFLQKNSMAVLILAALLLASGAAVFLFFRKGRIIEALASQTAAVALLSIFSVHFVMPLLDTNRSLRPFAQKADSFVPADQPIYSFGIGSEDLVFYSERKIVPLFDLGDLPRIAKEKGAAVFLFTDKKFLPRTQELDLRSEELCDTGIQQLDGLLLRVSP